MVFELGDLGLHASCVEQARQVTGDEELGEGDEDEDIVPTPSEIGTILVTSPPSVTRDSGSSRPRLQTPHRTRNHHSSVWHQPFARPRRSAAQ
jgi:hypothetical protein